MCMRREAMRMAAIPRSFCPLATIPSLKPWACSRVLPRRNWTAGRRRRRGWCHVDSLERPSRSETSWDEMAQNAVSAI